MPLSNRPRLVALSALLACLASGCLWANSPGIVSGKVTYKGNPVEEGEVQLQWLERGLGAAMPLGQGGTFTVPGPLPPGRYEACVVPPIIPPNPNRPTPPPKSYNDIPIKVRDFRTSGLSVEVKPGKNDVVLELTD